MNKKSFLGIFLAAIMGGTVALGIYQFFGGNSKAIYQTFQEKPDVRFSNYQAESSLIDFTYAAELSTPSVVHIKTYQEVKQQQYRNYHNHPFEDMLREFFGEQYQQQPRQHGQNQPQEQERRAGSGSGVIVDDEGYIVTNNHVIRNADKIEVVLNDKRRYVAELVGTDPGTDLALLKIDQENIQAIKYGNSDHLKIGEWVLAVGNPFDLTSTVTAGIVSAKARNINILNTRETLAIESFIQTDAAVNPGNSGGALVNLRGELIGINTAIASPTGAYAGYAFAVPVAIVQKVITDLKEFGEVQRALLGVSITEVTAELAEQKGIKDIRGVYVADVREGGSADEAGLKADDVILKVNDVDVNSSSELQETVARYRPGDKVTLTYLRDNKIKKTNVVLKNKMGGTEVVKKGETEIINILGADLKQAEEADLKKIRSQTGVKVVKLHDGKFKQAGIQEGYIITAVDKNKVTSPDDIVNIINNKTGGILIEGVYPNGRKAYYAIGW